MEIDRKDQKDAPKIIRALFIGHTMRKKYGFIPYSWLVKQLEKECKQKVTVAQVLRWAKKYAKQYNKECA